MCDHAWVSTPDGTIVDTTHGQFDVHVSILIAKPGTPEHRWYLRTDDMSDTQRLDVYGSGNRTSSGGDPLVEDAIAELRAAGAPFDVVDEGLETRGLALGAAAGLAAAQAFVRPVGTRRRSIADLRFVGEPGRVQDVRGIRVRPCRRQRVVASLPSGVRGEVTTLVT